MKTFLKIAAILTMATTTANANEYTEAAIYGLAMTSVYKTICKSSPIYNALSNKMENTTKLAGLLADPKPDTTEALARWLEVTKIAHVNVKVFCDGIDEKFIGTLEQEQTK